MIVMLEDDAERLQRFQAVRQDIAPCIPIRQPTPPTKGPPMATCLRLLLACLTLSSLVSCGNRAAPAGQPAAAAPAESAAQAVTPFCGIQSVQEIDVGEGLDLRVWSLKANGLKRLNARLLVARDGVVQVASEAEYKWPEWGAAAPEATGQLVLLVQDGTAFGVQDKRIPQLALDLKDSPSHAKMTTKTKILLEGELHFRASHSAYTTPLQKQGVIYSHMFVPKADAPGDVSFTSTVESVAEASKGERTVLAVSLEWEGQ